MPKHACPICGDPNAFPLWIDPEPPPGCPDDAAWVIEGRTPEIRNIAECPYQRKMARQRAALRKLSPDCFDENGNMKPGRSAEAWGNYVRANYDRPVVI